MPPPNQVFADSNDKESLTRLAAQITCGDQQYQNIRGDLVCGHCRMTKGKWEHAAISGEATTPICDKCICRKCYSGFLTETIEENRFYKAFLTTCSHCDFHKDRCENFACFDADAHVLLADGAERRARRQRDHLRAVRVVRVSEHVLRRPKRE